MSRFEQLGIQSWLAKQCDYMALKDPTPIQQRCIPAVLQGNHVVGGAATGSGKTAAFALPILQELSEDVYGVFALVLTPSRELAYQIADQFIAFGAPLHVRTMLAIGGVRHEEQIDALKTRPPIVVATPGRLVHLLEAFSAEVKKAFNHLRFLVLDEADRLTEGDIQFGVKDVLKQLPPSTPQRQVLMFSATLEPRLTSFREPTEEGDDEPCWPTLLGISQQRLDQKSPVKRFVVCNLSNTVDGVVTTPRSKNGCTDATPTGEDNSSETEVDHEVADPPVASVSLAHSSSLSTVVFPDTLAQRYIFIPDMVKLPNLVAALRAQGKGQSTIVFANSCMRAELVRLTLQLLGFPVCSLNSLLTQQHRLDNLALFKLGIARILVATDIASRGLDIPVVNTVLHYDVPKHASTYVHRVGRTARAGREGTSVALVTEHDVELVQRIEKKLRIHLDKWTEKSLKEEKILSILDEVSAAKIQAKQQVSEQFGNRATNLKSQAAAKKAERWEAQRQQQQARSASLPHPRDVAMKRQAVDGEERQPRRPRLEGKTGRRATGQGKMKATVRAATANQTPALTPKRSAKLNTKSCKK